MPKPPEPLPPAEPEIPDSLTRGRWKAATGYVCLAIGVAGCLLPILPGIPFLLVGLKLLGPDHPVIRPFLGMLAKYRPGSAAPKAAGDKLS
jgi:hypothetical protein